MAVERTQVLNRRDTNKVLDIIHEFVDEKTGKPLPDQHDAAPLLDAMVEMRPILKRMDARTGKSDPSVRRPKKP